MSQHGTIAGYLPAPGADAPRRPDDSPAPVGIVGMVVAALFFVLFLGWASFARLDAAAIGLGQVTVAGNRQTVQHREGGIVSRLAVREGQHVAAGDVLVELSAAEVRSQERALANSVIELEAQQARLEAEITGGAIQWPASSASYTDEHRAMMERARRLQLGQYRSRKGSLAAAGSVLRQQQAEVGQQIGGYAAQGASVRTQRDSLAEQLANTRALAEKGFVSGNTVRQLERGVAQLDAATADYSARAAAAREEIGSMRGQVVQTRSKYVEDSAAVLRDTQFQLNELRPRWLAAQDQLGRVEIRAPVAGRVVGLTVFTKDGVVQAGERILDIVPDAAPLIVRARFSPTDIDGVVEGREAEIRFESLHERDLPILKGIVKTVSADSLRDEASGASFFSADIVVPESQLAILKRVRGGDSGIRPGVPVQATVAMRPRTALQYLLQPLTEAFSRSFRER